MSVVERYLGVFLLAIVVVGLIVTTPARAQRSAASQPAALQPTASQPTASQPDAPPAEPIDLDFACRLIDATSRLEDLHANRRQDATAYTLSNFECEVVRSDGRSSVTTQSDGSGTVRLQIPSIRPGDTIEVFASKDDRRFRSTPLTVTDQSPGLVSLFQVGHSPDALRQSVDYLVTWAPDASDGLSPARLVAIAEVENDGLRFIELDGPAIEIPLPREATPSRFLIDGKPVDIEDIADGVGVKTGRGYAFQLQFGTGIQRESRLRRVQIECVLDVKDGDRFEIPFAASLDTVRLSLLVANHRFHYDEWTTRVQNRLIGNGVDPELSQVFGTDVRVYQRPDIRRGDRLTIPVDVAEAPPVRRVSARLTALVFSASAHIDAFEAARESGSDFPDLVQAALRTQDVRVVVPRGVGQTEELSGRTDADGVLALDLGEVELQKSFTVYADIDGQRYRSPPVVLRQLVESPVGLYRISGDASRVVQTLNVVVTDGSRIELDAEGLETIVPPEPDGDGRRRVRVREIRVLQNLGSTAYQSEDGGSILRIEAPPGAIGLNVQIDGETTVPDDGVTSVPVDGPLFPIVGVGAPKRIVSAYERAVREGERLDFSIDAAFNTQQVALALGVGRFHYDPGEFPDKLRLRRGERMGAATGMTREVLSWTFGSLEQGQTLPVELRYGEWRVAPRTWRFIVWLAAGFGGVIALAIVARLLRRPRSE